MTSKDLLKYRLQPIGRARIVGSKLEVRITDHRIESQEKCVYAFCAGAKVLRIGSSKAPLGSRLRRFGRDVTRALRHQKSPTPRWEAIGWKENLAERAGRVYARPGTQVRTPIGRFRAYLDEESILIGRFQPILNRNKHR